MKKSKTLAAGMAAACALFYGGAVLAQPTLSSITPNGSYQLEWTNRLTFALNSSSGVTGISVQLTARPLTGGATVLSFLTSSNGLTLSGPATSETVTAPLSSNYFYTVAIQATDANGTANFTDSFDTMNVYTWEAVDYDYTANGITGLFIDNPQVDEYNGLVGTLGVDWNHNGQQNNAYNRAPGPETEPCSDTPRPQHRGLPDYDVGYNGGGDFGSYTRHYPAGTYYVFLRGAGGNGPVNDALSLTVSSGTATFNGSGPFQFNIPNGNNGWQNWTWDPLIDASTGNPATITFDGSASTLLATVDNGNCNEHFYMLVPTNANPASTVTLSGIYPDGAYQFEQTNALAFNASSTVDISTNGVLVQLTGTSLLGSNTTAVYTAGNGLVFAGTANDLSVSCPVLQSNTVYTAYIQVSDLNGGVTATTITFDTVSSNYYTFEAEDFNYQAGQFFDNPQTNAFYDPTRSGLYNGVSGVDFNLPNGLVHDDYWRNSLNTEVTGDKPRVQYGGYNADGGFVYKDYDLGYTVAGQWSDYTRHFPAGQYNIYLRGANGNGPSSPDSCAISFVTGDPTQGNQTITKIGTVTVPNTGGWQTWSWFPVVNSAGSIVPVTLTGNEQTLRMTADGNNFNANYFMLVPLAGNVKLPPFVSSIYPDGTALFQQTNALSFTVTSEIGIPHNGVSVILNGVNMNSNLTFSGTSLSLNVKCPLRTNLVTNVAIITLTDNYGSATITDRFDTLSPNVFTFEAEDYDYNGGQFFDNQIDVYNGLDAFENIDEHDQGLEGNGTYRPYGGGGLGCEATGDVYRPAYIAGGYTDYDVGYYIPGNWANYTRTYPAGVFNVYIRASNPGNNGNPLMVDAAHLCTVTSGLGTASQTTTTLGTFNLPYTGGWQNYVWAPLLAANGDLAQITLTGTPTTLQVDSDNYNFNVNYYMLVPADLTIPDINNVSPTGAGIFNPTTLSFTVSSTAGIATNAITVTLNGVVVSNLVFTGSSTSWTVSDPNVPLNGLFTAVITATSLNGNTMSQTNRFDTFDMTNYQWEAEDYDFGGGQYFDNPQVDAYNGSGSIADIDNVQVDTSAGRPLDYRANLDPGLAPATSPAGDVARLQFTTSGQTDYSIGFFGAAGSWANYTRHYPAGTYNIIGRLASGNTGASPLLQLAEVTSGVGTANQTTRSLGAFTVPNNGWSGWEWVPLLNTNGTWATVTLNGSPTTLQLEGVSAAVNANFFMLVPAPAPVLSIAVSDGNANLSFYAQTGYTYQIQYKTNLTDAAWINLGSPAVGNNTTNVIPDPIGHLQRFYRIHP